MKKGKNSAFGAVAAGNEFSLVVNFIGIVNLGLKGAKQLASVQKSVVSSELVHLRETKLTFSMQKIDMIRDFLCRRTI